MSKHADRVSPAGKPAFTAALRLAAAFSVLAAIVTMVLETVGSVSPVAWVATVAVVGFTTSWVVSGRRDAAPMATHRIAVIPLRQRIG